MRGKIREFRHLSFLKSVNLQSFLELLRYLEFSNSDVLVSAIETEDRKLLIQRYEEMPGPDREKLEQVLTRINDFNSDDGMGHLVANADNIGLDRHDLTALELAIKLFLSDRQAFEAALRMLSIYSAKGYEEFIAKKPVPCENITDDSVEQMKAIFSEQLKIKEYGKKVFIEQHIYPDRLVLMIWTEHFTKIIPTLNDEGQLDHTPIRPVYDSTIIYYPDEGKLKVKANNGNLVDLARQGFADICLQCPDLFEHPDAKVILDLERFKRMRVFPTDEKQGVLSVRLTGVKGKIHSDTPDSVEIRFYNHDFLEDALMERNLDMQDLVIQKIWIQFKLRLDNGNIKQKTITLSAPHTTNLADTVYDRIIEQTLKQWGVLTGVQRVLALA